MVQAFDDTRPRRLLSPNGGNATPAGRIPPHNLEAEESLLGAMLLSRDAIASAMEICQPEDFYKSVPRPHLRRHHRRCSARGSRPTG